MSYERDRSTSETDQSPGGVPRPFGPGKANLTDSSMIQRKANGSGGPVGPGKLTRTGPGTRDLVLDDGHDLEGPGEGAPAADRDPRITTPAPGGGANVAATVVGATAEPELARDGGLTPALIAALHANPDLSIDEVLQHLAASPIGEAHSGPVQHPTIVQYGRMAQGAQGGSGGSTGEPAKKHAVLIANQNYEDAPSLRSPLAEATEMQGELSSRGYDVNVHADKTSADMGSLWGAMVGAAKPGDDLVAHYGGHGIEEGLLGINHHRPPGPSDLFTNSQVSGVVSSATGKGAHLRFVLDSCHSGAAVQAVREVRENELAKAVSSPDDKLRVDALASLRQLKQRLLGLRERRTTVDSQLRAALDQHSARTPDPANAEATKQWTRVQSSLRDVVVSWEGWHAREEDKVWAELLPQIEAIRAMAKYPAAPPPIFDYRLGAQLNYLDDLWNAVSQPVEDALAKPAGAQAPGAQAPGAQAPAPGTK
jgi:hypothetical protein